MLTYLSTLEELGEGELAFQERSITVWTLASIRRQLGIDHQTFDDWLREK